MSERYSRLFALSGESYTPGAPVTLAAGALLKDNQTGKVLAQLKLRSISPKPIKAAKVQIIPMDTVGRPLGEPVEHAYLDLSVSRNVDFGQKSAILLPDAECRRFSARVTEVAFGDNTVWSSNGEWKPLPYARPLQEALPDVELYKQYRLTYGNQCRYLPSEHEDLWYCGCGALNRKEESTCHKCGLELFRLKTVDWAALDVQKNARVAAEQAEAKRLAEEQAKADAARRAEEARQQEIAAAKAKKKKKIGAICAVLAVVVCAAAYVVTQIILPAQAQKEAYAKAQELFEQGKYEEAIHAFTALGEYEDSAEMVVESKYQIALESLDKSDFIGAENAFTALGNYKNSSEMILETRYRAATAKLDHSDYSNAEAAFLALGTYKDSAELAKQAHDGPLEEKYQSALTFIQKGNYSSAYSVLSELEGYKDSATLRESVYASWWDAVPVGMRIEFGAYPQTSSANNEPIEWYVLDKTEDKALLFSVMGLDWQPFHSSSNKKVYWKDSEIQKWLNSKFVAAAFSDGEKEKLIQTDHEGSNDLVFFLSGEEAEKLPTTWSKAKFTLYAKAKGADAIGWWTRTDYYSDYYKWHGARSFGSRLGAASATEYKVVRPAIWVSLP